MSNPSPVLEYKCPCCDAGLVFGQDSQKLSCTACGNTFELDAMNEYHASYTPSDEFQWEKTNSAPWSDSEQEHLQNFTCPSCGGELLTDDTTTATFCPYCENPAIIPGRVSGGLKPDAVIPFKTGQQDARNAFMKLCRGKPLLPKDFASQHRVEKITGLYVPFWLYSCCGNKTAKYKATRVHHWSDSKYYYRRTDHYLLSRGAKAAFEGIPMDGSQKMDNAIMESIEPFDYSQAVSFDTAYLSGFLADKYDVEYTAGEERIRQRVERTLNDMLAATLVGYSTAIPTQHLLQVNHTNAKYVLLPVWMLHSRYKDKDYVFAMNGQTGKMTGTFPICLKRSAIWFTGICAAVTAVITLIQYLIL